MVAESAIVVAEADFLGTVPIAYLAGRQFGRVDIRGVDSQNPGDLNVYRQFGRASGLDVLTMDTGKGAVTLLSLFAIMLWQITAVTVSVGAVLFAVTRHPAGL